MSVLIIMDFEKSRLEPGNATGLRFQTSVGFDYYGFRKVEIGTWEEGE